MLLRILSLVVIIGLFSKDRQSAYSGFSGRPRIITIDKEIKVGDYFSFMDSVVDHLNSILPYQLTEHDLVHRNSWIIDSLRSFDYYLRMQKGQFIYDQQQMVIFRRATQLRIPDSLFIARNQFMLQTTIIDLNIPEYTLRIINGGRVRYKMPVRVGKNEHKFLQTAGREVDLRTPIGEGKIVRVERDPYFVNPVSGSRYTHTRRDDGKYTLMPRIPWLEPEINGLRPGSLIHPTTNPETLGKAYSNGCVGTAEGDAWLVYYFAPLGTTVRFRYQLDIINEEGDSIRLQDIYGLQ